MARPEKNNLDYFSHDCDMRNDIKIKALRRKFGHKGYSIYVMMLEHLGNCEYLQYEWNDLSIELLTPEFDIDSIDLKEIIEYCVFLKLFQIEEDIIFSKKFYDRNQEVLNKRKSFDLNNSPLTQLKKKKLSNNSVNSSETIVNSELIHKVKESKINKSKINESILQDNIEKEIEEQLSKINLVISMNNFSNAEERRKSMEQRYNLEKELNKLISTKNK